MKSLLVIPAYNEAESIASVVDEIARDWPAYDYVVVNDGSTDTTAAVCRQRGYKLIDLPENQGLGGAFQKGVEYALEFGYDCIVQFDADGQHRPEYLDSLVEGLNEYDIVIGSRYVSESKPSSLRSLGSNLIGSMIRLTTGERLTDPTSGMRAYGPRALCELAYDSNLGPEPDTLAYLMRRKGLSVGEVQVRMADRIAGKSYLDLRKSSAYMARMALSVLSVQFRK